MSAPANLQRRLSTSALPQGSFIHLGNYSTAFVAYTNILTAFFVLSFVRRFIFYTFFVSEAFPLFVSLNPRFLFSDENEGSDNV